MPSLDEGSFLDMPVTSPRVSVTQAAADLKIRDAIIRGFPEVELIVGKAGRADTPTDPSPLDMVESVITLRLKEHWPRRKLEFRDAQKQVAAVMAALQKEKLVGETADEGERRLLAEPAAMNAIGPLRRHHADDDRQTLRRVQHRTRPAVAAGIPCGADWPLATGQPPPRGGDCPHHRRRS